MVCFHYQTEIVFEENILMRTGLLVGLGSIGKRHCIELKKYVDKLIVIEPTKAPMNSILDSINNYEWYESWSHFVAKCDFSKTVFEVVVLSNWAPDRWEYVDRISSLQFKRILLEKPIASKLIDLAKIEEVLRKKSVSAAVNFHLRYSMLPTHLRNLADEFNLGEVIKIVEFGGAKCFAANGVHWIDFACTIFNELPKQVSAQINFQPINPRSNTLLFSEGEASWYFKNQKSLTIVYSNQSSIPDLTFFVYKHALVTLRGDALTLDIQGDRVNEIGERVTPITRTTPFTHTHTIKEAFLDELNQDGITRLYTELWTKELNFSSFTTSTKLLLKSFVASKKEITLDLENDENIEEVDLSFDWLIT